jgi:hypothetical protein
MYADDGIIILEKPQDETMVKRLTRPKLYKTGVMLSQKLKEGKSVCGYVENELNFLGLRYNLVTEEIWNNTKWINRRAWNDKLL